MSKDHKPFVPKTPMDFQKLKLDRLMANPEKPVIIPEMPKEKKGFSVPEFVRNVMGSSAGAGSGEFHVYRHLRRKEYTRQKVIDEKAEKERLDEEFHMKIEENKRKMEERTEKRRAKRLKKKEKLKQKQKAAKKKSNSKELDKSSSEESDENASEPGDNENASEPGGNENVSEPAADENVSEPADNENVSENASEHISEQSESTTSISVDEKSSLSKKQLLSKDNSIS